MQTSFSAIQVPVTFEAANRLKDRSVSLRFQTTLEVNNADFAAMDLAVGNAGWVAFKPNEVSLSDIPKELAPEDGFKSPSKRLRNTLYRIWEQQTDQSEDFDREYYPRIMNQIIDKYKAILT